MGKHASNAKPVPAPAWGQPSRPHRRWPWIVVAGLLVMGLLAGGTAWAAYRYDQSKTTGAGIGGLNPYERGNDQKTKYSDTVGTLTSLLSSRAVNELRVLVGPLSTYWTVDGYADPYGVSISRPSIKQPRQSQHLADFTYRLIKAEQTPPCDSGKVVLCTEPDRMCPDPQATS